MIHQSHDTYHYTRTQDSLLLPADTAYICLRCGSVAAEYLLAVGSRIECSSCGAAEANGVRNGACKGWSETAPVTVQHEAPRTKNPYLEKRNDIKWEDGNSSEVTLIEKKGQAVVVSAAGVSDHQHTAVGPVKVTTQKGTAKGATERRLPPQSHTSNRGRLPLASVEQNRDHGDGLKLCACGCGKVVENRHPAARYASKTCKNRAQCRNYRNSHRAQYNERQREIMRKRMGYGGKVGVINGKSSD